MLVVVEHDAVLVHVDQIIARQHRNLPAAARGVDHEMRNRHAARVPLQRADDFQPGLDGGPEVIRALRQVRLIEIVGFHTGQQQFVHQPLHDLRIVVDAFQEHGLGAERDARVRQHPAGGRDLRRQLVRMVEMQVHINGVILFHDLAELRGDPLRQRAGDAGTDAHDLQVRDRAQSLEYFFQQVVGEQQRIAAGENHVPHFRMFAQIGDRLVEVAFLNKPRFADEPLARAEAAVDRALVRDHQQRAVRVAVNQMGHRAHQVFFERVVRRVEVLHLGPVGNNLLPDGVARLLDRGQHRRRDAHRVGADDVLDLLLVHAEPRGKISRFHHALGKNFLPGFHSISSTSGGTTDAHHLPRAYRTWVAPGRRIF